MKLWVVVLFFTIQILAARSVLAEEVQAAAPDPSAATADAPAAAIAAAEPAAMPAVPVTAASAIASAKISDAVDAKPVAPVDDCKDTFPQLETEYSQVIMNIRSLNQNVTNSHDDYMKSFQQATQALVDFSQKKEDALQKIIESRQALQQAMQKYAEESNDDNSKALQDSYMNLTVRLYSQAMEGANTIDALKAQMSGVESARGQYEVSEKSQANLDEKKLELESKMATLKIRCQKN